MTYIRKTRDYWSIQQWTGSQYGWEEVTAEDTWREAREQLKCYRENQPEYPVRARRKREKLPTCEHSLSLTNDYVGVTVTCPIHGERSESQ